MKILGIIVVAVLLFWSGGGECTVESVSHHITREVFRCKNGLCAHKLELDDSPACVGFGPNPQAARDEAYDCLLNTYCN